MALLEVNNISKLFDEVQVLDNINFSIESGIILCLLGASGCGKTTLLRIIAGLESPDTGTIVFNSVNMEKILPYKRGFRMMFQEFALFPHKNVFDNIAFGLNIQKLSSKQVVERTSAMLSLVGLETFGNRNVNQLSGGERQRVALARCLAPHPTLLMLDEPLGALDLQLRKRLMPDLNRILRKVRVPTILVTHDQSEAFAIADRIAVIHNGKIEQIDSPEQVYRQPANTVVAQLLGFPNLIRGSIKNDGSIKTSIGSFYSDTKKQDPGRSVTVLVRPESARLASDSAHIPPEKETIIHGKVKNRVFQGPYYHISIESDSDHILLFDLPNEPQPPNPGERISLKINPSAVVIID